MSYILYMPIDRTPKTYAYVISIATITTILPFRIYTHGIKNQVSSTATNFALAQPYSNETNIVRYSMRMFVYIVEQ